MDKAETGNESLKADLAGQMEAIVAEHETALLRYATRILNDVAAAEDVVQNVFVKLFQGWKEGMRPSGRLKSWLYRVTHNEAVDFIRRESRLELLHRRQGAEAAPCQDGIHGGDGLEERRVQVLAHVRSLPQIEQQVLLLRLDQGLSYREIAEITGRTEGNVGCILHNAVAKISKKVVSS